MTINNYGDFSSEMINPFTLLSTFEGEQSSLVPDKKAISLQKILLAWFTAEVHWDPPSKIPQPEYGKEWETLWLYSEYELPLIALSAGMSTTQALIKLEECKRLKMILPDGRLASQVEKWFSAKALNEMAKTQLMVAKLQKAQLDVQAKKAISEKKTKKLSNPFDA